MQFINFNKGLHEEGVYTYSGTPILLLFAHEYYAFCGPLKLKGITHLKKVLGLLYRQIGKDLKSNS